MEELTELVPLVREAWREIDSMVRYYESSLGLTPAEALLKAKDTLGSDWQEVVASQDPERVSWVTFEMLRTEGAEGAAHQLWQSLKQSALDDFKTGQRGAELLEPQGYDSTPAERAAVLALRQAYIKDWQPRTAVELTLIDQLVQAHTIYERWLKVTVHRMTFAGVGDVKLKGSCRSSEYVLPRLSEIEAQEHATTMVDRWQKMYLRTLRALRDLRRYSPSVVIQNAAQVNVANQQVNVTEQ